MDRAVLFSRIRPTMAAGRLSQRQVDGINRLLDVWERERPFDDLRFLAYCLATSAWETDWTFTPIEEVGGKSRKYGQPDPITGQRYYGRGDVQLTHKRNYERAGKVLGIDLVNRPELVLEPKTSAMILFTGMRDGWFTGHRLDGYFTASKTDWTGARRIVNGTDRATIIAARAQTFHAALVAAARPPAGPILLTSPTARWSLAVGGILVTIIGAAFAAWRFL